MITRTYDPHDFYRRKSNWGYLQFFKISLNIFINDSPEII